MKKSRIVYTVQMLHLSRTFKQNSSTAQKVAFRERGEKVTQQAPVVISFSPPPLIDKIDDHSRTTSVREKN